MVKVKGLSGISTCRNGTGISRNLIYTGVTRGKQLIVIFGPAKGLGQGGQDSEIIRVLDPLAGTTGGGHSRIPGRENRMSCGSRPIR